MKKYCFGIDVGGTTVKCGLFTTDGEVVDKWEVKTRTEDNGAQILPDIAASIKAKIAEKNIADEVEGIGIGLPGPVDDKGILHGAVNLHWVGDRRIEEEFSALTGYPVKAGNDANVAALGELWKGAGVGYDSLIMVTLGTGVGGGIVINGKVIAGSHGAGGEIGHAHVTDELTDKCNCGCCGCLEQVASATGIARLAREELAASDEASLLRDYPAVSAKSVFDCVKQNDAMAIRVAKRFGDYLAKALSSFAVVADPQAIVIGGGVSKAGEVLLDYIREPYQKYTFFACRETDFVLATLGNDAGIFGAAKLVL